MGAMPATKRGARPIDMVWSLAVILVPLAIIIVFFTRNPSPEDVVKRVDYAALLDTARAQSPYPVLAPQALPDTWVATKAVWTMPGQTEVGGEVSPGHHWALGYLSPDRIYVSLDQRDTAGERLVQDVCRGATGTLTSTVGSRTWRQLESADAVSRCLVSSEDAVVTIVAGDMSFAGLEAFASTLA